MGYEIECIIDIHNYPGEYFCPVCRTLVYPNESLQSQCTHVFCKPCLSYVANSTRACPYDGYLVTEVDSKPLAQSDTTLAENIGKVKVRCLYHRSGCTWDGCLAESTSHCLNCSFGYSPVICNRCSFQIVHRQVNEHALTCPGAYSVQQVPDAAAQAVASSGVATAAVAASLNQATVVAGAPTSQPSQPAPLQPGQEYANQKANANPQADTTVQATALSAEQLYQQQYQQYYQQYAAYGYDQYQQAYQLYNPYQQVPVQQNQQPVPQVSGQPNLPTYGQAASSQAQVHPPSQTQVQSQALTQLPVQQTQAYASAQPSAVQLQTNAQLQVQHYVAAAENSQLQPTGAPTQYQLPVNPQQPYSAMQPHGLISSQSHQGLPASLPQPTSTQPQAPQPQSHPLQPQPHVQTQYQQPHATAHNHQPSHYHMQPQMLSSQSQPQQVQPQLYPQPHLQPSQSKQATVGPPSQPAPLGGQPQLLQASGLAVSGYHSYMQPKNPHQQSLSAQLPPNQMQGQLLPQPPSARPPPLAPLPNQPQGPFSQSQVPRAPSVQQQPYHQQNQPLTNPNQQRPVIHSGQHAVQQYAQQPISSSSQLIHQNQYPLQQSQLQSQVAPSHMMPQNSNPQLQQNAPLAPGSQFQQPHSYAGRPLMQNHGVQFQPQSSSGFFGGTQVKPTQFGSYEQSANQTRSSNSQNQIQTAPQQQAFQPATSAAPGLMPRQDVSERGVVGLKTPMADSLEPRKSESGVTQEQETLVVRPDKSVNGELLTGNVSHELSGKKDGLTQHINKLPSTEDRSAYSLENGAKLTDAGKQRGSVGDTQIEGVESKMHQNFTVSNSGVMSTTVPFNQQKSSGVPTFRTTPPSGLPHMQIPGPAANPGRTLESGALPQSRLPSNQFQHGLISGQAGPFGRGLIPFGASQGSSMLPIGSVNPQGGVVGRPQKLDGDYMRAPSFGHPSTLEPNTLKMNGEPGLDQRFMGLPKEHLSPYMKNHTSSLDQESKGPSLGYDARPKADSAGSGPRGAGMFRRDMEHWTPRSPDKEYFGRKGPMFGEAPGHNRPGEVNPFRDNRYPPFSGFLRRGEQYGPEGLRFGENQVPGHPDHVRRHEQFGSFSMGEGRGHADLSQKPHSGEPFLGNRQGLPRLGEPGFRSNFPLQGFPNEGPYAGDMAHSLRKRKYSMGWCRICKVDCETVEGLDMHSQTREHQKMSIDMVMNIKQQNMKFLSNRTGREFGNKKKHNGVEAWGKKA